MEPVALIFADAVEPRDLLALVESLGGELHPSDGIEARLSRGHQHVWVVTEASGALEPIEPEDVPEYEDRLGAPPRSKVVLDMSDEPGADRLAFEIVAAAAKHWRLVVDDNQELVHTVDELRERLATGRPMVFADPGRRVSMLFAEPVGSRQFLQLVESLGGRAHADGWTDARLTGDGGRLWVTTGESPTPAEATRAELALGQPPRTTVALYLTETPDSERLAAELVMAASARWRLVVHNDLGVVFTVDELRARMAAEQPSVFWDDAHTDDEGDDDR